MNKHLNKQLHFLDPPEISPANNRVKIRNEKPQPDSFRVDTSHTLYFGNNLDILKEIDSFFVNLVYVDPPFNTGKKQSLNGLEYNDVFKNRDSFIEFINLRIVEIKRILKPNGSLFFHIDQRQSHYCKIMLDQIFGEHCFMNEIIWAYDYGGRSKNRWSRKHDSIFWYANDPSNYVFNLDESDRVPYLAPKLVGEEKAKLGKIPTDVWWHTIVPTNSAERTGYPTQKPLGVIDRIVKVHSNEGDLIMDCFAGSGTIGESAARNNRNSIMIDINPSAIDIIKRRMSYYTDLKVIE
jgi:site-specific DNA-methyltransferase (adenine-specific)